MRCRAAAAFIVAQTLCAALLLGADITSGTLQIQGIALEIETRAVTTGVEIPTTIQTRFAGKINDEAPSVQGLLAIGDLTGPGIDAPIQLSTAPGFKFQVPGFATEGVYTLQNVRLMNGNAFVAPASPSTATITVANVLQTTVTVHQLTPDELRARGINLDGSNYVVYHLTGGDAGVAIVDVTAPAAPRLLSVIDTPGIAFAAAISGPDEIAIADGTTGLTFLSTADKQHPVVLGSQALPGNCVDVRVAGGQIHIAAETRFYVVRRP